MRARNAITITVTCVLAVVSASYTPAGARSADPASAACPDLGDAGAVNDSFPGRMSSLVGSDIRTGRHPCFERVVLELQGTGELPGYWVRYENDPILESPSGEPTEIAGNSTLVLSFGSWMTTIEGEGYSGPTEIVPTNVSNILELELIESFEGQSAWAIGLDQQRDFVVTTLVDPVRIVIDIAIEQAAPPPGTAPSASLPATR